jgi:transcriptional regulator with XRE-family HTH domain
MAELKDKLADYLTEKQNDYQDELRAKVGNDSIKVEDYQFAQVLGIPATSYSELKRAKRPPTEERMEMIARTYPTVYVDLGVPWMRGSNKLKKALIRRILKQVEEMNAQQLEYVGQVSDQLLDGQIDPEDETTSKFMRA